MTAAIILRFMQDNDGTGPIKDYNEISFNIV
jgi:hypothetical protein